MRSARRLELSRQQVKVTCSHGDDELAVSTWFYSPGQLWRPANAEDADVNPLVHNGRRWQEWCHQGAKDAARNPGCVQWRRNRDGDGHHLLIELRCLCGRNKQINDWDRWEKFLDQLHAAGQHSVSLAAVEKLV